MHNLFLYSVVEENLVGDVLQRLQGLNEKAYVIGEVVERKNNALPLVYA